MRTQKVKPTGTDQTGTRERKPQPHPSESTSPAGKVLHKTARQAWEKVTAPKGAQKAGPPAKASPAKSVRKTAPAGAALRESEDRFRALVQASSAVVYRMSADWKEMRRLVSRNFLSNTTAPSRNWLRKYIPPADRPPVLSAIRRAIRTKSVFELEHRVIRADGRPGWTHSRAVPILDARGNIVEWFGMASDITARKEAEESLRRSEAMHRIVADNTYDWEFWRDAAGRFLYCSPACERITGHTAAEFLAAPKLNRRLIHPADRPAFDAHAREVEARHQTGEGEWRFRRPDGTYRWIAHACQPVFDAHGAYLGCRGSNRDISERKQGETALQESEERHRTLFEQAGAPILLIDPQTLGFVDFNDEACRCFGYTRTELAKLRVPDLEALDSLAAAKRRSQQLTQSGGIFETKHRTKNGTILDIEVRAKTIRVGGRTLIQCISRDITARKQGEAALREHNAKLEQRVAERTAALTKANRTLLLIRACHEAMLRATQEDELLVEICRLIVQVGGEQLAWVGLAENDARKTVRIAASNGDGEYIRKLRVTWADEPRGRGPVGTAIRTGQPCLSHNTQTDPCFAPWQKEANRAGYGSCLALPLRVDGRVLGALAIYAARPKSFNAEERLLLTDLANDLAFGLGLLRLRAERERLENEVMKSVEREQERIGRDLHDDLCQVLVGAKFRSGCLREIIKRQNPGATRNLKALENILNRAIERTRDLARGLNPVPSSPNGLRLALQRLADNVELAQGPQCAFRCAQTVPIADPHAANQLYRIAQEAVQNALKHARARNITVSLARRKKSIVLSVRDDGVGLPRTPRTDGMGVHNLRLRAKLIGAQLEIKRAPQGGTLVLCTVRQAPR